MNTAFQRHSQQEEARVDEQVKSSDSVMSVWNPSPSILPGPQLLHELALSGSHDAYSAIEFLTADGDIISLSYHSLSRISSKLAAQIVHASQKTENFVVPVLLPQSLELYITWVAILMAGGAFCPLNIDAPPERIEFILQDVAASVVITQGALMTRVPQNDNIAVINTDGLVTDIETDEVPSPALNISSSNLAYVMYTSGSTGRPKGVGISHLAATQSLLAHNDLIPPFTRFLQFASPTFDVSVFEVFFPLMRGATLIGSDREQMLLDISHVMTTMKVDAAELTPTVAGELLRTRAAAPSLRVLLTIGEMLTKHVVDEFGQSKSSDGILHGMYGPTEAAIHCTAATKFQASSRVNLIGRPFETVSAFIMSLESDDGSTTQLLDVLPLGQIGELVIGGSQLADGYINRPDENAKAFIEHPVYGRLYRTGDKALMLPSGEIECFGRISSGQVKLRGQRIELGEIEHAICRAPGVRSSVTIVGGGSLAAFVLVSDKGTTDRELRDVCRQWLPRFMVPGEFILVTQFPQLPSGKVDRKALEAEFIRHHDSAQTDDQQPFRDELEETITLCVADVLDRQLHSTESLAAAGLDSLAAIRLTSHILEAGIRLDVAQVLDADCVEQIWLLAKELEATQPTEDPETELQMIYQLVTDAGATRIESLGIGSQVTEIEPSSHIQQAMILETVKNQKAYCNWIELEFESSIKSTALQNAFFQLVKQNSLLRSGFVEIGLKDHSYARFTWKEVDERLIQTRDVFDYNSSMIAENDLLYPLQVQLKETDQCLRALVQIHHSIYDGWSWQMILEDLHHLLAGENVQPKPAYNAVTKYFIEYKLSELSDESSLFWRDQLQGISATSFPKFHGKTDVVQGTRETLRVLDVPIEKLNNVSQSLRVSRQTIFQAAFCYILSTYLGSDDVVFGTVFSGRTIPVKGIESVLGPCIRTLPTRMNLDRMQNITDLLLAIQNMNRKSLEHGSLPLQDIKKISGIDLHQNLFDAALVWQESIWSDRPQSTSFHEVDSAEFLDFALLVDFEPRNGKILAKVTYQEAILPHEQALMLLEQIDCVAGILIESPNLAIDEIGRHLAPSILSVSHSSNLNQNISGLVAGVEKAASAAPSRTAVEVLTPKDSNFTTSEIQTISYGRLNSRANCFAHHLLHRGAKTGDLIAILLDESIDCYVSILAVAKIGAGLLPLNSQTSAQNIHIALTSADAQFCIIPSSAFQEDLSTALGSIQQIHLPEYLDNYHDSNFITNDDHFHIVCAENSAYYSSQELQSQVHVLASSFSCGLGSKILHSFPRVSADYFIDTFLAWHTSSTLCSVSEESFVKNLQQTVNKMEITHLSLPLRLASLLTPKSVPSVQFLFTSGEPLNAKVLRDWSNNGLCYGYKTHGLAGIRMLRSNYEESTSLAGIGMPLVNTSAMIVRDSSEFILQPHGAVGELCFGVKQEGHNNRGLKIPTTGFIDHPQFGRVYRTGDYGRFLSDDTIVLLSGSHQENMSKFMDLEEIELVLVSSKLVQDSLSLVLSDEITNQPKLVTVWVPSKQVQDLEDYENLSSVVTELFEELGTKFSHSKLPSHLVPIVNIPMTDFYKTDYEAIQRYIKKLSPETLQLFSGNIGTENSDGTLTDVEKIIATALSAVTGAEEKIIRRHTSFYKLGLDSLSAISFSRKLQESGCGRLPVSTILRQSSVAQLAASVSAALHNKQSQKPEPILEEAPASVFDKEWLLGMEAELNSENLSVQGVYACTPLQEAMLAAESDLHSTYFNHILLRLNTDAGELKNAWVHMLQRHDILRTCFRATDDVRFTYAQFVLESATLPWSSVEISPSGLSHDVQMRKSEFEHQSPISGTLPYSLTVFTDHITHSAYLLLSIHHALYDGQGISQLLYELQLSLSAQALPEVTPFHKFIEYMVSSSSTISDKFWDRYLSGVSPTLFSVPENINGIADQSASQKTQATVKSSLTTFKQQCKDLSVTPLNVFHAAWARLLSLYADSSDVCFGNVFSCRTIPLKGADKIVGPCFNTLPIRVKLTPTSTNADIMKISQKNNSDILPHQLSTLRQIQRRALRGGSQLFDTLVILQSTTEVDSQYWEIIEDEGNMGFPLICEILPDEANNTYNLCIHFQTSYLSRDVVKRLARSFVDLVEHTLQYPSAQASDRRSIEADIPHIFAKNQTPKPNGRQISTVQQNLRALSDQEEFLRGIICNFSGINPNTVSLHTTLFQLGLDSINAVQISGKLRSMGYKIPAGDILEAASIEKIASLLESSAQGVKEDEFNFNAFEKRHLPNVCAQLNISLQNVQSLRPCTSVQNGMLALYTRSQGDFYFNRMALNFSAPLDKILLKEAWSKVMAQHEMLRTGFAQLQDKQYPFAMITYQEPIGLPWHETDNTTTDDIKAQQRKIFENIHRPPWQITIGTSDTVSMMHFSALHALYDAQSLALIFSDVEKSYLGKTLTKPVSIPAILGPILVESRKQSETTHGFWKGLAPEVQPSKFPDLNPIRTENKELLGSSIRCSQSLETLESRCREIGVTLQAAGQVAWARLLSAYTGEQNVTFGVVLSGRSLSLAAQDAVFPCLVTMPSPHHIEETNRELLSRAVTRNASLVKNQFTSLGQIQKWLGSEEPLFDTLFVYQKFSSQHKGSASWDVVEEDTRIDYPVSIELIPHLSDLEIRLSYRSDLVPEIQATTILNQYNKLLEQTVLSPDSNSDNYLFLGDQLLSVTPAKEKVISSPFTLLHQFVENNAQNIPNKLAFEFASSISAKGVEKKAWSYRELNEDGNRVAHYLQNKGVRPGGMVAICLDKCPEASIAILGILKAGCSYLAIDPMAPISRKKFIIEDSGSTILFCNQSRTEELSSLSGVEVQAVDEAGLYSDFSSAQPLLPREISPDDSCYCLYTSGTTGTPKGCEITHNNAVQAMLAFQKLFSPNWDEDSRWLQFASFHFDVSVLEQYWSWSVGICVTSCPRDLLFEDLPGTIQKLQITHIDLTPSLAKLVHPDEVPSLCRGVFITGGEQLKQEILDDWGRHGVIYNGYGPTEVTIGCTMLPRMRANDKPTNIGPQFDNVGSYVFRPGTSTPVLRGGLGELCVSGPLVGKGYLNRAELTRERFQDLSEYGDRVYRTGDLVRILYDGSFQFLGRIDDQVKLRGQRLEIGEINEVIKQSTPELNEVATLVIKHPKQSKDQLVSFITSVDADKKAPFEVSASEKDHELLSTIKAACYTHLPGYMVPTHIIPMTRFPLSANNKADMKVLKSLYEEISIEDIQKLTSIGARRGVKNVRENEIISVLAKFVGSADSSISSWSSIYELGLDSISVIAFSRSLREAGFTQAQPSLVMKNPTIAGMASALQTSTGPSNLQDDLHRNTKQAIQAFVQKNSHSVIESLGISDSNIEQIAPCTPLQEGIIYHFLSSNTPLYCSTFRFPLTSSVDLWKLKAAWQKVQNQVQMLRARFAPSPDGYAQVVLSNDKIPWFQYRVNGYDGLLDMHSRQAEAWASQIGDLSTRLWEVGIITYDENHDFECKHVMFLNIFHALYDGNSSNLLLNLVSDAYFDQKSTSEEAPNFLDVLHLGPLCKDPAAEVFWKDHLANSQSRPLSNLDPENYGLSAVHEIRIDTTEHLDKLRKSLNVTDQAILHTCWLLTLHEYFKFVPPIGIIASGRSLDVPGIANIVGPLFNTIPSDVQLRGLKSWSEVARRCHEYHVSTLPFQYTALRDIAKWLKKSPNELVESLFVFQRESTDSESSAGKLWTSVDSYAQHEYPLAFEIVRNGNTSLCATLATKEGVIPPKDAKSMLSNFQQILYDFSQNPDHELSYTDLAENKNITNAPPPKSEPGFEWTPLVCKIRDVIANIAGVDAQSIGENTSIFEVGLDSIDAIKLSSRLSKLGVKLPVSKIMRCRNVQAMSKASEPVESTQSEQNEAYPLLNQMETALTSFLEREGLSPPSTTRVIPATPIQEAMVAEMTSSGYINYYNHEILELEPHVDLLKLQEAWKTVVTAHPILRTSFVEVWDPAIPTSYAQVIHSEDTFDLQTVHLHGSPVDSVIELQRKRAASDLKNCPLLTITTVLDENVRYLVLSIAHSLYDGWSINLLHGDVAKSYMGEHCTRPAPDAILEQILASSGERALKFWRATLSHCTPATFPARTHLDAKSTVVYRAERTLSISFVKAESFCKRHGITIQALLVTCWSLILASYVNKLDVVFGLVLSGRNMVDSEHVMFPTMNTVAMRVILHGTRLELVKYVQETLLGISEHQHFPLRRARPDAVSGKLFDTLFIYQKSQLVADTVPCLYKSTGGASDVDYPVCAEVEGAGENLVGRVACRASVLGEEGTLELLEHMALVLASIVNEPTQQTVDVIGDSMNVSGYLVLQNNTVQDVTGAPVTSSTEEWSSIELTIRNILSIVSGVPEDLISKDATIFQLGLDSISAIKVAALLKKQSVKLAVSDMLRAGTIEKMANAANMTPEELTQTEISKALEDSMPKTIDATSLLQAHGVNLENVQSVFPATAGQIYFLAMHTLNPEVFYSKFSFLASTQLSQEVLDNAWLLLQDQTPILRTAFIPTQVRSSLPYIQFVMKSVQNPVHWHEYLQSQAVATSVRQNMGTVPVALHACQTEEGTAITLKIHHALYDAVSLPSMMQRLAQLCSPTQPKTKYGVYDISQLVAVQHIQSPEEMRSQFWKNYLGQISTRHKEQQGTGVFGAIQQYYRPSLVSNMSQVNIAAKAQGLSIQSIFLAVYARVHAQIVVDTQPLVVGLYLANRSHVMEELSEMVAPTVNIVPLRLDNKNSQDPYGLFAMAHKIQDEINEISMAAHSSVSLAEIALWTGVHISTCINFLRLPELEKATGSSADSEQVTLKSIPREEVANFNQFSPKNDATGFMRNGDSAGQSTSTQVSQVAASTAAIEGVFWPTIDVEAAIREEGLDFGLFAPESLLDGEISEKIIEAVKEEMMSLTYKDIA
ncbi:AMP-dependent synthetase/ligase [Penicillium taxi]|uniref:AMP-dependent synthetase/ligase n=1 Tax=Penicillium taxi TaxID=168475 RepID=UPI0025452B3B|nr:AMP-dependent synthetase/ligase [Penicillium taxi]KAJ5888793.1 AMP-dependent synthetase/ligase [Penicillium taxi]